MAAWLSSLPMTSEPNLHLGVMIAGGFDLDQGEKK
jgi:hypothetical protein